MPYTNYALYMATHVCTVLKEMGVPHTCPAAARSGHKPIGKGHAGSALMGSLQFSVFLAEGLFGYSL